MYSVLRALAIYLFLMIIFRVSGKRTLTEATPFDVVLLLIISETTSAALVASDFSITNCFILVITLVGADILLSLLKQHSRRLESLLDGHPVIIVEDGRPRKERMDKLRVDEDDILSAARLSQGLERMDQIKYAIIERSGEISIIPKPQEAGG